MRAEHQIPNPYSMLTLGLFQGSAATRYFLRLLLTKLRKHYAFPPEAWYYFGGGLEYTATF